MPPLIVDSTALFEQTPVVMLTLDRAGRFVALNPAAERLFAGSAVELNGQPLLAVLDPFSHAKAELMLERTLAEGGVTDWELGHFRPDGGLTFVGYSTCLLRDPSNQIVGVGVIGHDLTSKTEPPTWCNLPRQSALLWRQAARKARRNSHHSVLSLGNSSVDTHRL